MVTQAEQTVLHPDQLANELEAEVATEQAAREAKLAVHQERRSALAKTMGLDVGPPNEKVQLANGAVVEGRDDFGLLKDDVRYASKNCNHCYGRGVVVTSVPVAMDRALRLIADNPANEALLHQAKPGKYTARKASMCICAQRRFTKKREEFLKLLVREGLAEVTGVRVDGRGNRSEVIELL